MDLFFTALGTITADTGASFQLSANDLEQLTTSLKHKKPPSPQQSTSHTPVDSDQLKWFVDKLYIALQSPITQIGLKAKDVLGLVATTCRSAQSNSRSIKPSEPDRYDHQNRLTEIPSLFIAKVTSGYGLRKQDLQILDQMIQWSSSSLWPDDLLDRSYNELCAQDYRVIAGRVVAFLLNDEDYVLRLDSLNGQQGGIGQDQSISSILIRKIREDNQSTQYTTTSIHTTLSRFLYPKLFELRPNLPSVLLCQLQLLLTSSKPQSSQCTDLDSLLHMYIRTAAEACSHALIKPSDLDPTLFKYCMHHAVDDIRLASWTALTVTSVTSRRVEQKEMELVKEWLRSNYGVYNAEYVRFGVGEGARTG